MAGETILPAVREGEAKFTTPTLRVGPGNGVPENIQVVPTEPGAGDPLKATDDAGPSFAAYRTAATTEDLIAQARARVAAPKGTPPSAKALQDALEAPGAAARPPGPPLPGGAPGGRGAADDEAIDLAAPAPLGEAIASGAEGLGRVAAGVGRAALDAPLQAIGGVSDAVHNAFTAADNLAEWLNQNVADLKFGEGEGFNPLRAIAGNKNEVPPAQTAAGAVVRDVSRFVAGFAPWMKLAKGAGALATGTGKVAATAEAAGVAEAATSDKEAEGLSKLVQDHPALRNPVTEFLAAGENDSEALVRFKKGLEAAGVGVVGDGLIAALKAMKAAHAVGVSGSTAVGEVAAQRAKHGAVTDRDFIMLGDPTAPLFKVEAPAAGDVGGKMAAAHAATAGVDPGAQRLVDLAARARASRDAVEGGAGAPRTLEDLEKVTGEEAAAAHKDVLDAIDELRKGPKLRLTKSLTGYLARLGGLQDQGGEISTIVGGKKEAPRGLIKPKGMTLDDAAYKAWEDGYFPELGERPTVDQFLEALRADYDGTAPRFHPDDWAALEHQKYLEQIDQELERAGIDWRNDDRPAIARQLDGLFHRADTSVPAGEADLAKREGELNAAGFGADFGGKRVNINFARINGPDDIKAIMGQMADHFAEHVGQARRGVQSNEETARLADELGMSVPELLSRRQGQPFNAEQALAARQLWAASAEKLLAVAQRAAAPNAGPVDQFNFRKMMATHFAIQAEVVGARTETARALQAWSIPAGSSVEKAKAVQQMVAAMGGPDVSAQMAKRLSILAETGTTPAALNGFVRKSWAATGVAAFQEAWVGAMLSNPKTHIVNSTSNTAALFTQIYERAAAAGIGDAIGSNGVATGEAVAMAYGLITGLTDAFRMAARSLRAGELGDVVGKVDLPHDPAISSQAFGISSDTGAGRAVDLLGHVSRASGRLLGAEDAFFKSIGYRMEVHAQALRQATAEGLEGEAMYTRLAELANNPPENIRLAAADAALYSTFTNTTGNLGQALLQLRTKVPAAVFVLPFVKTPVNLARYAFERSPVAPLVGQWRADIAAGGARRDVALARMATGSTIMALAFDLADRGTITGNGPADPAERAALERQGWQPNAVKVGDQWLSYGRLDPFGMTLGFSADMAELLQRRDVHPDKLDELSEVIGAGVAAVARTAVSKTYLQGASEFFSMVHDGEKQAAPYIGKFIGSMVPAIVAEGERMVDPSERETMKIWEYAQARLPGLSDGLPERLDLWGRPESRQSGYGPVFDALSPIAIKQVKPSPIDAEMQRLHMGVDKIDKRVSWDGAPINFRDWPRVYEQYERLAGNELKHPAWGLGLKDFLDQTVSGKGPMAEVYRMLPDSQKASDGGKAQWIHAQVDDYRRLSRAAIMADPHFANFQYEVQVAQHDAAQRHMPVGSGSIGPAPTPPGGGAGMIAR